MAAAEDHPLATFDITGTNHENVSTLPSAKFCAISGILEKLGKGPGDRLDDVWLVFDFDGTLSEKSIDPATNRPVFSLRGGASTKRLFESLKARGAHFFILTAAIKRFDIGSWDSVVKEIVHYDILQLFDDPINFLNEPQGNLEYNLHGTSYTTPEGFKRVRQPVYQVPAKRIREDKGWSMRGNLTSAGESGDKGNLLVHLMETVSPERKPAIVMFFDDYTGNIADIASATAKLSFPAQVVSVHMEPSSEGKGGAKGRDSSPEADMQEVVNHTHDNLLSIADLLNYPASITRKTN